MLKKTLGLASAIALVAALVALPGTSQASDDAKIHALLKEAFKRAPEDWANRINPDETMKVCSATINTPTAEQAKAIEAREKATIKYPADNNLIGDWKKGEALAQSGYGMRFTDYPPQRTTGGNCYACHQLTKAEVSFGTIGPSLLGYGKDRGFKPEETKAAYEKIYNAHAAFPCSLMPRFGSNGVLSIEDITHLTALLMSPDSPVNK